MYLFIYVFEFVFVVYVDFSKAFDKVPTEKLILKMEAVGLHRMIINGRGNFRPKPTRLGLKASTPRSLTHQAGFRKAEHCPQYCFCCTRTSFRAVLLIWE